MIPQQIAEFLEARRGAYQDPEAYRRIRQALRALDRADVLPHFEARMRDPDLEVRAQAIEGLTLLYGNDATPTILPRLDDESETVRWVVCGCLHDYGDGRALAGLLERLRRDPDASVRGAAASALGQIGDPAVLPQLFTAWQSDHEVDPLGYTPSGQAGGAISDLLRRWVIRHLQGASPRLFDETTPTGRLEGRVTAEAIPFDEQGRLFHTARYRHLTPSECGYGLSTKMDLVTPLVTPFEVEVVSDDPHCRLGRTFVFQELPDDDETNWAIHTILSAPMRTPDGN